MLSKALARGSGFAILVSSVGFYVTLAVLINAVVSLPTILLSLHQIKVCAHIDQVVLESQNSFGFGMLLQVYNLLEGLPAISKSFTFPLQAGKLPAKEKHIFCLAKNFLQNVAPLLRSRSLLSLAVSRFASSLNRLKAPRLKYLVGS